MKKMAWLLPLAAAALAAVGLTACGSGGTTTPPAGTTTTRSPLTSAPPSRITERPPAAVPSWHDMPTYAGATQAQKGSWSVPPAQGEYTNFEWRYYETDDSLDKVSAFYKARMPDNGWTEKGWMELPEMHWGMYEKSNENDAAMVWTSLQDGKTVIAMWRATK